jgi:Abnormal spindle-like microcephaly-assoc'd, ASPM-SPD-2-Hydin
MRLSLLFFVCVGVAGCRCGTSSVSSRFGELVVVQQGANGREVLVHEATVPLPPTFMDTLEAAEVPVRNVGQEEISVVSVMRLEGDTSLSLDDAVGMAIAPQVDATLPARFAPAQAADATTAEVVHRAKFAVQLSGARPGEETLLVELVATAVARDCFVPARIDFGQVPLQQAIEAPVTLTNGSSLAQLNTVGSIMGTDATFFFSSSAGTSSELSAGAQQVVTVRFSPLEERAYAASLSVRRAAGCPEGLVQLTGEGRADALSWSPTRLDFGRIPLGAQVKKVVTVVNHSNIPLSLRSTLSSTDYVLASNTPGLLPAQGSVTIEVSCAPQRLGPLDGLLTLDLGTTPSTPARIPLTCVGGGPRVRVDPNPLQYGVVPLNRETVRRIIVQNVGTAPPSPGDLSNNLFLGTNGAIPWFAVVPKNANTTAAEFNVALRSTYDAAVGVPAVAVRNLLEFEVSLTPRSLGLREADLLVYTNDSSTPVARVALTATPRLPESCTVILSPEGANFGPAPRGSVITRTITVTNDSANAGATCLVSGIEMAPGSDLAFQVTDPGVLSLVVPSGQSRLIRIQAVVPGDAAIGDYLRGTLRLQLPNEATPRALPVDLLVSQCLVVDPPIVDVGVVQNGCTSASKAVTLFNICGVPITLSGVSTPGAPFRITSSPFSGAPLGIAPSDKITLQVAAAPAASGTFVDALRLESIEGGTTYTQSVALRAVSNAAGIGTDSFTQTSVDVDILFVLDNSCSMADEQQALASNFASFINSASQGTGNWHIGVITTDPVTNTGVLRQTPTNPRYLTPSTRDAGELFSEKVQLGVGGSGDEEPYFAMSTALSSTNRNSVNAGFIRTDAALAVIIVTDALEQSPNSPGSYLAGLRQLKGNRGERLSVSVVGPFSPPGPNCSTEGSVDDGRFSALINATNGVRADICTQNWAMDLETISRNVFGARRSFDLASTPRTTNDITVTLNGMVLPNTAWSWDTTRNTIVFTSAPAPGAMITVDYRTACF